MVSTERTDVAVVGGGPGGYAAAFLAADLGLTTALVDPEVNPGGVCVYRGCIPSKALLHVANLLGESRHAEAWGITFGDPTIDLNKLRAFKDQVVARLTSGTGLLAKSRKVQYLQGLAELIDANTLRVKLTSGGEETVYSLTNVSETASHLPSRAFSVPPPSWADGITRGGFGLASDPQDPVGRSILLHLKEDAHPRIGQD